MALNDTQTAVLHNYLVSDPDHIPNLSSLLSAQNYDAVANLLNEPGKKSVQRRTINGAEIIGVISDSDDFDTMAASTLNKLQWIIQQREPVDLAAVGAGIDRALRAHPLAAAKFAALKTRLGSYAEALFGEGIFLEGRDVLNARP